MNYCRCYQTAIGAVTLIEEDGAITELLFGDCPAPTGAVSEESPLLREAASQLTEYLGGERREFQLPLNPKGTDFQRLVWAALRTIPYGEARSYGEIAHQIGRPKASRAVGMANHRNPIAILIPCHRVIGSDGKLVGYGGGLDIKEQLLKLEGVLK